MTTIDASTPRGFVKGLSIVNAMHGETAMQTRGASLFDWLLAAGVEFRADAVDWAESRRIRSRQGYEDRQCFHNAQVHAALRSESEEFDYFEGWAIGHAIPVEHAWLVSRKSGRVIDPTWTYCADRSAVAYFGVAIPTDFILNRMIAAGATFPQLTSYYEAEIETKGEDEHEA